MTPSKYENDELFFLSEDTPSDISEITGVWNVLVADDDEEIHSVTRLALSDLVLNDKNLHFIHAYSGSEALKIIESIGDIYSYYLAICGDGGLTVARIMREEIKNFEPRMILCTGQPGYAPEEQVIKDYDINDYKTRTELTRSKLVTTIIASLRSYQHKFRKFTQCTITRVCNLKNTYLRKNFLCFILIALVMMRLFTYR